MRSRFLLALTTACTVATTCFLAPVVSRADVMVVTNTQDSGEGSLRQAITDAEARAGSDTIVFNIPSSDPGYNAVLGVWTIQLDDELPDFLYGGTFIDGASQAAFVGADTNPAGPEIEIDGLNTGLIAVGFRLSSSDNTLADLVINGFTGVLSNGAILIDGANANRNVVRGCYIGTDVTGTEDRGNITGVTIIHGAQHNTVGGTEAGHGNLLSGNSGSLSSYGVWIRGQDTDNNQVVGNYIGTDASGALELGNARSGVCIDEGAQANDVTLNLISANGGSGILVEGDGTDDNEISGNTIGLAGDEVTPLGNRSHGVAIKNGPQHNLVRGSSTETGNTISSNGDYGVYISGDSTAHNYVESNRIGTDAEGVQDRGNGKAGVYITSGSHHNVVGRSPFTKNVISGNDSHGIWLSSDATENTVRGNYIGVDSSGRATLGNTQDGIRIENRANANTVGGYALADANVISGNRGSGIRMSGNGTSDNTVAGNYIGTDLSGRLSLRNTSHGIYIGLGASDNTIGPSNTIMHNGAQGVYVYLETSLRNTFTQNSISGNGQKGISIYFVSQPEPTAPTITEGTAVYVAGQAPPGATVEVFSGPDDEGMYYEGTVTAGAEGQFRLDTSLRGRYATATATDAIGTTSEFSQEYEVQPQWRKLYLPIVVRVQN